MLQGRLDDLHPFLFHVRLKSRSVYSVCVCVTDYNRHPVRDTRWHWHSDRLLQLHYVVLLWRCLRWSHCHAISGTIQEHASGLQGDTSRVYYDVASCNDVTGVLVTLWRELNSAGLCKHRCGYPSHVSWWLFLLASSSCQSLCSLRWAFCTPSSLSLLVSSSTTPSSTRSGNYPWWVRIAGNTHDECVSAVEYYYYYYSW